MLIRTLALPSALSPESRHVISVLMKNAESSIDDYYDHREMTDRQMIKYIGITKEQLVEIVQNPDNWTEFVPPMPLGPVLRDAQGYTTESRELSQTQWETISKLAKQAVPTLGDEQRFMSVEFFRHGTDALLMEDWHIDRLGDQPTFTLSYGDPLVGGTEYLRLPRFKGNSPVQAATVIGAIVDHCLSTALEHPDIQSLVEPLVCHSEVGQLYLGLVNQHFHRSPLEYCDRVHYVIIPE
ncbi:hypothetical protein EBR57_03475 [bacterium]|nr:hypothetical protein [bacterium]